MKNYMLGLGLLLLSSFAFGQAPYLGGQGDGYAKTTLLLSQASEQPGQAWVVQEQGLLHLRGIQSEAHWQIFDALGREVTGLNRVVGGGESRIGLPNERVAAGTYLVRIEMNGLVFVRKWIRPND